MRMCWNPLMRCKAWLCDICFFGASVHALRSLCPVEERKYKSTLVCVLNLLKAGASLWSFWSLCWQATEYVTITWSTRCCLETLSLGHSGVPGWGKCKGKFVSLQMYCYFHVLFTSLTLILVSAVLKIITRSYIWSRKAPRSQHPDSTFSFWQLCVCFNLCTSVLWFVLTNRRLLA